MEDTRKIYFIGDVHGCLDELKALLAKIGWTSDSKEYRIIMLGDLLDRGPDSVGVVKFCHENGLELIRGNHDDRYVKYNNKIKWHDKNPNQTKPSWLKNYPDRKKILDNLTEKEIKYLTESPTVLYLPEYKTVAVHAGFLPGKPLEDHDDNTRMHIRFLFAGNKPAHLEKDNDYQPPIGSYFWADLYNEDWNVVYGHHVWDYENIKIHETPKGFKCWGIDTGACFGGRLTALGMSKDGNHEIIQVQSSLPPKKKED